MQRRKTMRVLWITTPTLNTLSVQDTIHTAFNTAYPSGSKTNLTLPKLQIYPYNHIEEAIQRTHRAMLAQNTQRIVISALTSELRENSSIQELITLASLFYAVTVAEFDIPIFLPEETPTEEEWIRRDWRHAISRNGMVGLTRFWEVVPHKQRSLQPDERQAYSRNLILI